ncbi:hypothetical protein HanPI659440_Chr09g0316171 [Helianthus annuus]|nr:hypothetical protein HanPI659440_Chr09g0316171 [Helianthus annuus]
MNHKRNNSNRERVINLNSGVDYYQGLLTYILSPLLHYLFMLNCNLDYEAPKLETIVKERCL